MSDSPDQFARKAMRMFGQADDDAATLIKEWVIAVAHVLVTTTPGPGNQWPPNTLYVATGRLRGGWTWDLAPRGVNTRETGGPYDPVGLQTVQQIADEIRADDIVPISYLNNDVAYGFAVHNGLGNHTKRRPWIYETAAKAGTIWRELVGRTW